MRGSRRRAHLRRGCGRRPFQEAAAALSITQQAVAKRIAALEKDLDVRLFTRTARGAQLTIDSQAFLPHARELLRAEERAGVSSAMGLTWLITFRRLHRNVHVISCTPRKSRPHAAP